MRQLQSGKEALQVSGPPNPVQLRNQAVVNALHAFHKSITQVQCGSAVTLQWSLTPLSGHPNMVTPLCGHPNMVTPLSGHPNMVTPLSGHPNMVTFKWSP